MSDSCIFIAEVIHQNPNRNGPKYVNETEAQDKTYFDPYFDIAMSRPV